MTSATHALLMQKRIFCILLMMPIKFNASFLCRFITMFNWKRPQEMPSTEPTEEQIWDIIDTNDPHHTASLKDRLLWHQEMLEGRDLYNDSFVRMSRIPTYEAELPQGHDPIDWVITLKLRHTFDPPLEQVADHTSFGDQEVLQPVEDNAPPPGIIRLLGYRILHHEAEDWNIKSTFGTPLAAVNGYSVWARFHLQTHYRVLKEAGIYKAIYASLFDYTRLPFSWIRGIAEHWDRATNTCWIGPHEMTITLPDMQDISGLPILGIPYEECIPPDYELFQRQVAEHSRKGKYIYSSELHRAFAHYHKLVKNRKVSRRKRGAITLDVWCESFLQRKVCTEKFARLSDPFDLEPLLSETSYKQRFEPEKGTKAPHVLIREVDEDTSLVAFIATWLCYFVFPSRNRALRPSVFLMASLLAQGKRVAIAPATLAYLYHGLSSVSIMNNSRRYEIEAPWHYLHGWIHAHISGSFSCPETPVYFREQRFPIIMQLSRATVAIDTNQIRTFMFAPTHMTDRFKIIHQSTLQGLTAGSRGQGFIDALTDRRLPLLLSKPEYKPIAEYLIGMRPSWLCYRRNDLIILEGYNPNRTARQFGFTQASPVYGLPQIAGVTDTSAIGKVPLSVRLQAASMAWAFMFRLGTESRFHVAPVEAHTGISHLWLMWIRHTYSSFLELGFRIYRRRLQKSKQTKGSSSSRQNSNENEISKRRREPSPARANLQPTTNQECNQKRSKTISDPAIRSPLQRESSPIEDSREPLESRNTQMASTSESTYAPLPSPNAASFPGQMREDGTHVSTSSANLATQNVHSPELLSNEYGSMEEQLAMEESNSLILEFETVAADPSEVAVETTVQQETKENQDTKEQPIMVQKETYEVPITGLELSCFVSKIRSRDASSTKSSSVGSLNYIIAALHNLLVMIDPSAPLELSAFCSEANSLLDCATNLGMEIEELRRWESAYRDIEFDLTTLHTVHLEIQPGALEEAKRDFNNISEQLTPIHEAYYRNLRTLKFHQEEKSMAQIELLDIANELKRIQQIRQFLLERQSALKEIMDLIEGDCLDVDEQITEIEPIFMQLTQKQEIASQHLQHLQERHNATASQVHRALVHIREVQNRFL